jgi:hypothetical protein
VVDAVTSPFLYEIDPETRIASPMVHSPNLHGGSIVTAREADVVRPLNIGTRLPGPRF